MPVPTEFDHTSFFNESDPPEDLVEPETKVTAWDGQNGTHLIGDVAVLSADLPYASGVWIDAMIARQHPTRVRVTAEDETGLVANRIFSVPDIAAPAPLWYFVEVIAHVYGDGTDNYLRATVTTTDGTGIQVQTLTARLA